MKFHPLQKYLEYPGAQYLNLWAGTWATFEERFGSIERSLEFKRAEHREASGGFYEREADELRKKISVLEAAHQIIATEGESRIDLPLLIDRMKARERFARVRHLYIKRSSYFEDALFELIDLYAENADLRFHELSPGAKESPSLLILFVADALASMNEHRSITTIWDRVNKAIKFARDCEE